MGERGEEKGKKKRRERGGEEEEKKGVGTVCSLTKVKFLVTSLGRIMYD